MTENKTNKSAIKTQNKEKSIDYSDKIFAHYHNKMRNEIKFFEDDFYEDNVYDEPEYWRYPRFREYNDSHHEIRP